MNCYLLIDFGSTFTKLTLIDIENARILAKSSAHTTINTSVLDGYKVAYERLFKDITEDVNIVEKYACSSAGGGLKMVAVGLAPAFTVEAAKRSALGAGARILATYNYFLKDEDIEEIENLNPDIILLTGGAEGGNKKYIIHNSQMIGELKKDIPIVVAGNSYANEEVAKKLEYAKKEYYIVENVMPDVNIINPDPVRETIRQIFMKRIMIANGMKEVEGITKNILMPTPMAVTNAAKLISEGTEKYKGYGDLMIVDIGGATTDVHTVSEPVKSKGMFIEDLEEPYIKRTVEGDLGMRYSAVSLFENAGEEYFKKYYDKVENLKDRCQYKCDNPDYIADNEIDKKLDKVIASICVNLSVDRHSGSTRDSYRGGKNVLIQEGKDLRYLKTLIGTGGCLVNSEDYKDILKNYKSENPSKLSPENPNLCLDKNYILYAVGLLSMVDKNLAFEIAKKNVFKN